MSYSHSECDSDALVDGEPQQALPLADRGLHYGDGLFETIAVVDGQPTLWQQHMNRLIHGCGQLLLPPPDAELLYQEAMRLIGGHRRCVLKIIYTAGSSQRGYGRSGPVSPRRILLRLAPPPHPAGYWQNGVDIGYCALRLMPQGGFAGIKHLGRLEQVLARREVDGRGLAEGLLLNRAGELVEAVAANVFAVHDQRLITPPIIDCGVRGIMRDYVIILSAELGLQVEEGALTPAALSDAQELFLTNSLIGIWPVRRLEGRQFSSNSLTRRLLHALIEAGVCLAPDGLSKNA